MRKLKYPIGISDFAEMRNNGYYYIDKTNLIVDLLDKGPVEVTQITRPRRFGKTLGMSTLANFLDAKTLDALSDACDTAIQQINDRMYAADFRDDYDDILCYGIAFFKKRCMVRKK